MYSLDICWNFVLPFLYTIMAPLCERSNQAESETETHREDSWNRRLIPENVG